MEGMTDSAAIINLTKLCVGVGILALPSSVAQGGLVFAPLGDLLSSIPLFSLLSKLN